MPTSPLPPPPSGTAPHATAQLAASSAGPPPPDPPAPARRTGRTGPWLIRLGLAFILILAFALRAWNLDWDRNTHLQPDERFWSDVAATVETPDDWTIRALFDGERRGALWDTISDPAVSPLNPRNPEYNRDTYVYGTLPLWASESAAAVLMREDFEPVVRGLDAVGVDLLRDANPNDPNEAISQRLRFNTGFDVTLVGRLMSALIDTLTVGIVFLIGKELADRRTGLLAALLQALTVLHIQYSHFLGSEPWVAFFVAVVVWGSVRLARGNGGWGTRLVTAAALGMAIGSKLNGIAAAAAPIAAVAIAAWPVLAARGTHRSLIDTAERIWRRVDSWIVMALVAIVVYRIVQPYDFEAGTSLLFNTDFDDDIVYLQDINTGGNWPWVQPLVGATPLWHPLKQVFLWGMGPGLGLAAAFGMVRAALRVRRGEHFWLIPLAVIGAYFVLVSLQFYAIIRYLQPSYPVMTSLAAVWLVAAWRWASTVTLPGWLRTGTRVLVAVCIGWTVFWGLAFVNGVYNNDNARLAAGDWMLENLPPDAVVSQQSWDDGLPWGQGSPFGRVTLEPFSFGGDTPERIELLIQGLDQVDYVIESSNKFYDALPRTPARFPQMTEYYERLFDGSLGFELIATFQNQPSLFGITIDDSNAEEAFTLYDHPTVFIWQKTDAYSTDRAYELLNPQRARVAVNAVPRDAGANAAMLRPDAYATQQQGSSFADVHPSNAGSFVSTLAWFAVLQLAAFAVAPFVLRAAGRSAGVAWGFTKALGLIALSFPVWLVVSWGWFDQSTALVWCALLLLMAAGAVSAWRHLDQLVDIWRTHRRTILRTEALFAAVFLAVVLLRVANPDTWHPWRGGEKPMELAYLTAVTGSTTLPPYDPWLAGGSLNYYYVGWFLLAVPIRILGIQPDIGFNLGVATYAALAAVTIFSTVALVVDVTRRHTKVHMSPARTGLLAVVLFLVIGNLDTARQIWKKATLELDFDMSRILAALTFVAVAAVVGLLLKRARVAVAAGLGATGLLFVALNANAVGRLLWRFITREPFDNFDWWDPSRVNKNSTGFEVTEFPSFTVLFADLHPHFMAMPIFGLGLAGCLALVERTRHGDSRSSWVLAVGLGAATGLIRMVHTWDLPTLVIAVAGSVVLGWTLAGGPGRWRAQSAIAQLVAIGVVHLVVTAPYRSANQVADSGFSRAASQTNLDDWVAHWGIFLFVAAVYFVVRLGRVLTTERPGAINIAGFVALALGGFIGLMVNVGSVAAWSWVGLIAALALLSAEVLGYRPVSATVFVSSCWALGFAVLVGVELFTQNADIQRLNTVFKFWLQVWHLFAIAAAFSAVWLWQHFRAAERVTESAGDTEAASTAPLNGLLERIDARRPRVAFGSVLAALLVVSLLYPVLTVPERSANRISTATGPSLQGQLWLEPGQTLFGIKDAFEREFQIDPGVDAALIAWLRANVEGRPTIVEAVGGSEYQWWGRISINTGLPAVLGWRWHQDQQRTLFNYEVNERKREVADFFVTEDPVTITNFLRAYDVGYVVVGSIEAAIAKPRTLELFAGHPALVEVFRSGDHVIYEVDRRSLAQASGAVISAIDSG